MKKGLLMAIVASVIIIALAILLFFQMRDPMMLIFGSQVMVFASAFGGAVWLLRRWNAST